GDAGDTVDCGAGIDTAHVDGVPIADTAAAGCETLEVRSPGQVDMVNGVMRYHDGDARARAITMTETAPGGYEIADPTSTTLLPSAGCVAVDPATARCTGVLSVEVTTSESADTVRLSGSVPTTINTGLGDDTVIATDGTLDATVTCGAGTDTVKID